jgi:putative hemolysin
VKKLIIVLGMLFVLAVLFGCVAQPKACTEEAMICPDGSAVGRTGPNCEFAPCPAGCACTLDWNPVCGEVAVCPACYYSTPPCLAPCTLEKKTYGNKCAADCEGATILYSGECDANAGGTGMANPASTNCISNGGTLKIVDTAEGQIGICTLPGGKECEEWAYFRGECS